MKTNRITAAIIAIASLTAPAYGQSKPTREVKMPTERNLSAKQTDYQEFDKGFFMSGELSGGWSLNSGKSNLGFTELDATGGYRFSEYLRVGIGIGARVYFDNKDTRYMSHDWGMPLFLNIRGNFIPAGYREVIPFWSFDAGTTFPDGAMIRPTVGIRVGAPRSAFIASIGYLGQNLRTHLSPDKKHSFYSFITLKLGYEF